MLEEMKHWRTEYQKANDEWDKRRVQYEASKAVMIAHKMNNITFPDASEWLDEIITVWPKEA